MLLTDARRAARSSVDGELIPLPHQDRELWDKGQITEGIALLSATLGKGAAGPYQLQAAIAAVHDEAARSEDTDWPQILALYDLLRRMSGNPMVMLNHAIAAAMVHGAKKGLELLEILDSDPRLADHYRLHAVRAHLLELAGDRGRHHAVPRGGSQNSQPPGAQLPCHAGRATFRANRDR
jgi:predicted RNA polymerase sigma factor